MKFSNSLPLTIFILVSLFTSSSYAATFHIRNNCPFTVWAAATPGGGRQLNSGEEWTINVAAGTKGGRVWARTGCNFDGSGRGSCQTGDCGGLLRCNDYGRPPNTLAEYGLNGYQNLDFLDISLVDGFNVPMEFSPTGACASRGRRCAVNLNAVCPGQLRVPQGCNNPCTTFKTDQYCCTGKSKNNCGPTVLSSFFKQRCPGAYSYPKDDSVQFTCPGGTNYRVVFCP